MFDKLLGRKGARVSGEPALIGRHDMRFGNEPALLGRHGDTRFASRFATGPVDVRFGNEPALVGPHDDIRFGSGAGTGPHQVYFGAEAPDYGAGDQGAPIDNSLAASTGGMDPFAVAAFGFEQFELHQGSPMAHRWSPGAFGADNPNVIETPGAIDLMAAEDGENMSFQPIGPDPYDAPEQIPTLRNPVTFFGFEDSLYSGFGPAAVIGCETGQSSILGCDDNASLLGCD